MEKFKVEKETIALNLEIEGPNREAKEEEEFCCSFIRKLIFSLFHFLGLSDFLETDVLWFETQTQVLEYSLASAVLIRGLRRRCAVCLYDFEVGEEIRQLTNCKHIFHRSCLDRWMDHDKKTYLKKI
ncbi:hypothetical protein VitviT2T_028544 [Vitis vinifera]|uniref:RING-type domain-containing protein n=1 Tax=Vitis vinifera TaxID=29760 RepID=A0ABY9DUH9_VITVI|nr:hypothetical protein VitviT2T_028544 [Vitis vinifera]